VDFSIAEDARSSAQRRRSVQLRRDHGIDLSRNRRMMLAGARARRRHCDDHDLTARGGTKALLGVPAEDQLIALIRWLSDAASSGRIATIFPRLHDGDGIAHGAA